MDIATYQEFAYKRDTVANLLELIKKFDISNGDKKKIYDVIMSLDKKTDIQKDRFVRFYAIKPDGFKKETQKEIAQSYNVTIAAVRVSIMSIQGALYYISKDKFKILESIYKKYQK